MTFTVPGVPIAKPRMTRRDKWKQRACVLAYRAYADQVRQALRRQTFSVEFIDGARGGFCVRACFYLPAPKGLKDRTIPHTVKPDLDNLVKGLLDAVFPNRDQLVVRLFVSKYYADDDGPRVEVTIE